MVMAAAGVSLLMLFALWSRAFNVGTCSGECSLNGLNVTIPMTGVWILFTIPAVVVGLVHPGRRGPRIISGVLMAAGIVATGLIFSNGLAPTAPTGNEIRENLAQGTALLENDLRAAAASAFAPTEFTVGVDPASDPSPCTDIYERSRGAAHNSVVLTVSMTAIRASDLINFAAGFRARGWEIQSAQFGRPDWAGRPEIHFRALLPRTNHDRGNLSALALPGTYVISQPDWISPGGKLPYVLRFDAVTPCLRNN